MSFCRSDSISPALRSPDSSLIDGQSRSPSNFRQPEINNNDFVKNGVDVVLSRRSWRQSPASPVDRNSAASWTSPSPSPLLHGGTAPPPRSPRPHPPPRSPQTYPHSPAISPYPRNEDFFHRRMNSPDQPVSPYSDVSLPFDESHVTMASSNSPRSSTSGGSGVSGGNAWLCRGCGGEMLQGEVAVCIPGESESSLPFCWHPACFTCGTCCQPLADLVYFWLGDFVYCERHYAEQVRPRCAACDELIFCKQFTQADGLSWHLEHFRCQSCDVLLAGQKYVAKQQRPYCMNCHDAIYAQVCHGCKGKVTAESKRLDYDAFTWHASDACFRCGGCDKSLLGKKFMCKDGNVLCSIACKRKVAAANAELAKRELENAANATVTALKAMAVSTDDSTLNSSLKSPPSTSSKPEVPSSTTTTSKTVTATEMESGRVAVKAPLTAKPKRKI